MTEIGRISIKVTPDTTGFREKVAAQLKGIGDAEIKVKAKGVEEAKAKIDAAARNRKSEIKVDVDKSLLSRVGGTFAELGNNLAQSAAGARVFGVGMGGVLAIATLIPPAISLAAGALLTLPAAAAGVLVPIGAIALGMDGIKKAAETLKQPFDDLKKIMSDSFQSGLTPVFERLKVVFPTLNAQMPKVAEGLTKITDALVQSVTSKTGLDNIKSTIADIGAGLANAAPGVKSFSDGILQLISSVATKFPGIGQSLSRIGDQFSGWIDKISTKDPATGVSQLDTALRTLKDTLAPIGGAIGDLFTKGFDKLNDPQFAQGMKDFTNDLRSLTNFSFDSLSKFFDDLTGAISEAKGAFKGIKDEWNGLPQGFRDFFAGDKTPKKQEDIIPLAGTPGVLKDGPLGKALQRDLDNMDNNWAAKWLKWLDPGGAATDAGTKAGTSFKGSFDAAAGKDGVLSLVPGGTNAAEIATKSAQEQIAAIRAVFKQTPLVDPNIQKANASDIIKSFGGGSLGASADIGVQLSANIQKATDQATATLRTGLQSLSTEFQSQLSQVGTASSAQIEAALTPLQQAPAAVQTAFAGVSAAVQGSLATVIGVVAQASGQITAAVSAGFAQVPGVAAQAFGTLQGVAAGGMAGLVTAITSGVQQAIAALQVLPQQIGAIGAQLFAAAQAAGAQVGAGLAAGIAASTGQAVAAAQALAGAVGAAARGGLKIKSPSRVFADIGTQINAGLAQGISGDSDLPISKLKEVLQAIKDVFGNASGLNLNLNIGGGGGTSGLVSQLDSASTSAKGLQSNLADAVAPTQALTAEGKQQLEDLKQQLAQLEIQRKELKIQKDAAVSKEDKAAIQAQIDQIQSQKDILGLEKDKLSYAKQYGEEQWNAVDALKEVGKKSLDAGFGFAKSNMDQLQSDLGIGGGAITNGANALWDWGTKAASQFIFNVSNVDDAISVKNNQINKQSLGIQGR